MKKHPKVRGIYERPEGSGIWYVSYFDGEGKWHREKVGRRSVALKAYHIRKQEIREGRFIAPMERRPSLTFGELTDLALAAKKGRHAELSVKSDRWRKGAIIQALGSAQCSAIDAAKIEGWLSRMHAKGLSGPTVNRYRALISSVFSYGVRMGKVPLNPVAKVARYKENPSRVRFLTAKEESVLRKRLTPQMQAEFDLALYTGIRRGEQFSMKWEQVDFDNAMLTVIGKTGRRFVPMNRRAHKALLELRKLSKGAYICPDTKYDGQRDWRRDFESAVKSAGIKNFTWHDLRHTFASRLVMAGKHPRSIQELLGHRSIVTTEKYMHLSASHLREAVNSLITHTRTNTGTPERKRKARQSL